MANITTSHLTDNYIVITGDDIQVYNWSSQTITLTQEASTFFTALSSEDQTQLGEKRVFVVTLNDKRLYGGCMIRSGLESGIDFPVMYFLYYFKSPVVFKFSPYNLGWAAYDLIEPSAKQIIEIPDVHDFFTKLGKLEE
jgi:hypothetical protein